MSRRKPPGWVEIMSIEEKVSVLFEYDTKCPTCSSKATTTVAEYRSPYETIVIVTLKCAYCGYKKSDVIPIIEEDENKCVEIAISSPQDLNTLLYLPPSSVIEIPEFSLRIELADLESMHIGSYVTTDAILHEAADFLESICRYQDLSPETPLSKDACTSMLETIRQATVSTPKPLTIRITNSYGNIRIVKTHRENYRRC